MCIPSKKPIRDHRKMKDMMETPTSRKELRTLGCIILILGFTGLLVSFNTKLIVISKEVFFPQMGKVRPVITQLTHESVPCTNMSYGNLSDWLEPKELWHTMTDEELMWRASFVPKVEEYPYQYRPKVAFMFLVKGGTPLAPLWERFFKGHEGLFSIYVHSSPDFKDQTPKESVFYRRRIPSQVCSSLINNSFSVKKKILFSQVRKRCVHSRG